MKKMRKLIPAFSMLLVAAIMLSTATFAWFTMNESVTASGMEIQAKASGNLLISTEKMTAKILHAPRAARPKNTPSTQTSQSNN